MLKRPQIFTIAALGLTGLGCLFASFKLAAADAPSSDWHIAGPFGGSAKSVALDPKNPNILLAGAMNSLLFKSQDRGESWQLLNFPKRLLF